VRGGGEEGGEGMRVNQTGFTSIFGVETHVHLALDVTDSHSLTQSYTLDHTHTSYCTQQIYLLTSRILKEAVDANYLILYLSLIKSLDIVVFLP